MAEKVPGGGTRSLILEAGRRQLLAAGYAGMSTRKVAQEAGVPVSQLNYHFGSKQGLILTLLRRRTAVGWPARRPCTPRTCPCGSATSRPATS
jgi:AcrR family transcriptional regulator